MGAGQTPAVSWNFLGARRNGKTLGWGQKGQSRLAGKGGRCQQPVEKQDHFPGIGAPVPVQRLPEALSIWEYPWPAPESLWEGAVWLRNCWLLCIWLSLTWDLLCSRISQPSRSVSRSSSWGFFIVNGSFPNKTIPCGKSCHLSCRGVGRGAVGLSPWKLEWD